MVSIVCELPYNQLLSYMTYVWKELLQGSEELEIEPRA